MGGSKGLDWASGGYLFFSGGQGGQSRDAPVVISHDLTVFFCRFRACFYLFFLVDLFFLVVKVPFY